MNPRKPDSRSIRTPSSWWAVSMTRSVCWTHLASEVSVRTSPTSISATIALKAAGSTSAWVSSWGTSRSGRTATTGASIPIRALARLSAWPGGSGQCYSPAVDLVAGTFAEPGRPEGILEDRSPADATVLLGRHGWAVSQVERAVEAARSAQPSWGAWPAAERIALVRRIGEALRSREDELARAIGLDVGKTLWESRSVVQA